MSVIGNAGTVTFQFGATGTQIALQAIKSIDAEVKTITGSLQNLKASIGTLSAGTMPQFFQQIGSGAEQASTKTQTFTERMSGFQGNLLTAATSVGTFTASIFGIDAAMDGLTQSELALEQARVRQDRMQTTLQAQEERLNTLRTSGTATAADIAIAEERVTTTRQQLGVQTEKVAFMQQNLNEQHAQFGAQILPQVITATLSGVTAITSLVELLGKSKTAMNFLNTAFQAFRTPPAVFEATGAVANLSAAMTTGGGKAAQFGAAMASILPIATKATGILAGIAAPILAWHTNFLNSRDILSSWGKTLGDTFPVLKEFLTHLENVQRLQEFFVFGSGKVSIAADEMKKAFDSVSGGLETSFKSIEERLTEFESKMTDITGAGQAKQFFESVFGGEDAATRAVASLQIVIQGIDEFQRQLSLTEGGEAKFLDETQYENFLNGIYEILGKARTAIASSGRQVPEEVNLLMEKIHAQLNILWNNTGKISKDKLIEIQKELGNLMQTMVGTMGDTAKEVAKIVAESLDPIGYNLADIQTKLAGLKLPTELALTTSRFTENIQDLVDATVAEIDVLTLSEDQMLKIAYSGLPEMTKALQKNHPEITNTGDALQYLVDHEDAALAKANPFYKAQLDMAKAAGYQATETGKVTEKLTEEEQKIADLAKSYLDLTLTSKEEILAKKAQVEWIENAIQKYDDQIESLKELQIEYGSNEQAVYGVNQATQDLITSKKDQIIQEQEVTLATIDVTKALDGSKESQILMNDAMIEGKTSAADFVTELVKTKAETEAFGKALSSNVMEVLDKMPDQLTEVADKLRSVLPETFESLSGFEGAIKPFDKDSLKEYKDMLDDMDISKHTKKLAIKAANIWQDKAEIIAEGDAVFSAISGIMSNKFKDIDVEDVTSFLDDIETRVSDWEDIAGPSVMTTKMRELITEIKNSKDPVKTFGEKWEEIQKLWDPKGMNDTQLAIKLLGESMNTTFAQPVIQNLELTNQLLAKLAGVDLKPTISQIQEFQTSILSKKSDMTQTDWDLLFESAKGNLPKQEKGYTEKTSESDTMASEWENAQARIQAATQAIADQVLAMQSAISASLIGISQALLLTATNVDSTQQVFSQFSTSVATYSTSMQTNFNTFATSAVANLDLIDTNVEESNVEWSQLSTSIATYTKSMTTNTDNWSTASVTAFNNVSVALGAFNEAVKILEETVKTSTDNMLTETKEWETEMVKSFKAVQTGADEATTAVGKLYDAVDKLEDKTITVTMKVNETGGTGSHQSGGVELLTGTKLFTGGEGKKPEVHFFFPLDEMAQSHAKSEFTLPFSIADLGLSKAGPATLMGKPSNQPIIPSNLISNLRVNANLTIDLGNEIKKRVREEINAIAVTRLDRMPF